MNVASMAPDSRASISAGPALNVLVSSFVSSSSSWKVPSFTPSTAEAWVTFGKYPSLRVSAPAAGAVAPLEPAEDAAAAEAVELPLEESLEEQADAVIATTATTATAESRERRVVVRMLELEVGWGRDVLCARRKIDTGIPSDVAGRYGPGVGRLVGSSAMSRPQDAGRSHGHRSRAATCAVVPGVLMLLPPRR